MRYIEYYLDLLLTGDAGYGVQDYITIVASLTLAMYCVLIFTGRS